MPPKPKKGGAGKKPKKETTPIDDINTTILTQEKLQEFCIRVHEALIKERQYSDFLRLDRDKLTDMVAISTKQLTDIRNRNRIKVVEMESAEDNHRIVMEQNRLKVINLVSEKNIECLNTTLETARKLNHEGECHEERMSEIISDINALKVQSEDLNENFSQQILILEIEHAENKCKLREKDKENTILDENKCERVLNNETQRLKELFEKEQSALEIRKNKETARLLKYQSKFSHDLSHYYRKIVHNNMSLIMVMKTKCQELKSTSAQVDKQLLTLMSDNKLLLDTVTNLRAEEKKLLNVLASAQRDQSQLLYTKKELEYRKNILESMKWELEALNITEQKQTEMINKDKKEEQSDLLDMKVKMEEFNVILELILNHLHLRMNEADSTVAIVREIRRHQGVSDQKLESALLFQDTSMDTLNYQLSSIIEQRELVTRQYKRLLRKHHLHMEDTGFEPQDAEDILRSARVLNVIVNEN